MRSRSRCIAAGVVLAVLPMAACGGDDEPTRSDQSADEAEERQQSQDVDPQAALLKLEDLPAGFAVDDSEDSDDDTPFGGCEDLESLDESPADDNRKAEASFTAGELGPFLYHQVLDQDEGTAAREFDTFRAALENPACQRFEDTDDEGRTMTWTLAPVSAGNYGDESLAFRLSGASPDGLTLTFDAVVERIGDNVSMVAVASVPLFGGPPPALADVATKADEKLESALS